MFNEDSSYKRDTYEFVILWVRLDIVSDHHRMTGVTLEEVCLLPSDSGGERLGCFCHYSDRQNGEPAQLPPQPGGTKDDSGGVKGQRHLSLMLRPYRLKSDCNCLLCISRWALNHVTPATTAAISTHVWKYSHSNRMLLCQFDFDNSFSNKAGGILESSACCL